jgi:hypothetical protein
MMENGADRVITVSNRTRFPSLFFLVSASGHRRRAPSVRIAQPSRFEFQGVKYPRVECGRTAFVVPALS